MHLFRRIYVPTHEFKIHAFHRFLLIDIMKWLWKPNRDKELINYVDKSIENILKHKTDLKSGFKFVLVNSSRINFRSYTFYVLNVF